jgi:hypothetical protein
MVVMMSIRVEKLCKRQGISLLSLAKRSDLDLKRLQTIYRSQWTPSRRSLRCWYWDKYNNSLKPNFCSTRR